MTELTMDFPAEFFEEEEICGYTVSPKMKKVWAIEMDLLYVTIQILEKYNLKYYAMGGTLLGAIRHQGYIPWDDDIDIIMPREDYNKLLEIGPKEFKDPYFFQCPLTEEGFWRTHVQIRNSNTTGYIKRDNRRNNNKGIFIDIFVLDEIPDDKKQRRKHLAKMDLLNKIVYAAMDYRPYAMKNAKFIVWAEVVVCKAILKVVGYHKWFRLYQKVAAECNGKGYKSYAHTTLAYHEGKRWQKSDWEKTCMLKFHNMELVCPAEYDRVLEKQYGKGYMEIPTVHPSTTHGGVIFNTELPYKEYFK